MVIVHRKLEIHNHYQHFEKFTSKSSDHEDQIFSWHFSPQIKFETLEQRLKTFHLFVFLFRFLKYNQIFIQMR